MQAADLSAKIARAVGFFKSFRRDAIPKGCRSRWGCRWGQLETLPRLRDRRHPRFDGGLRRDLDDSFIPSGGTTTQSVITLPAPTPGARFFKVFEYTP